MNALVIIVASLVAGTVQSLVPTWPAAVNAPLPLLASIVCYYGLRRGAGLTIVAALVAGSVQDALGAAPLGYSSVCLGGCGLVAARLSGTVRGDSLMAAGLFGLITAPLSLWGLYLLQRYVLGMPPFPWSHVMLKLTAAAFWGLLVTPPMVALLGRMDRFLGNVETRENLDVLV